MKRKRKSRIHEAGITGQDTLLSGDAYGYGVTSRRLTQGTTLLYGN